MSQQNSKRDAAPSALTEIADNIIRHLEAMPQGVNINPEAPPERRAELVALVQSILVLSLDAEGFLRLEHTNGDPLKWRQS